MLLGIARPRCNPVVHLGGAPAKRRAILTEAAVNSKVDTLGPEGERPSSVGPDSGGHRRGDDAGFARWRPAATT